MGCAHVKQASEPELKMSPSHQFKDPFDKILMEDTGFGIRGVSDASTASGASDGSDDLLDLSWSSWNETDPAPYMPPTRQTHEAFNNVMGKFLNQVEQKPKRFEKIVSMYRARSGFTADEEDVMETVAI
ncbi:unnamed protein product [Durusdinium trenchii]|uniref:Uncharacterized protein n=2 Tax=Durusdinium trenchii TaxID=1381693 RepID=A0ABP0I1A4_9DINO